MARFKTKPNYVEAIKVEATDKCKEALTKFLGDNGDVRSFEEHEFAAVVVTPAGVRVAPPDFYVMQDISGFHVMSEAAFNAVYEPDVATNSK